MNNCTKCGGALTANTAFCGNCGNPIVVANSTAAAAPTTVSTPTPVPVANPVQQAVSAQAVSESVPYQPAPTPTQPGLPQQQAVPQNQFVQASQQVLATSPAPVQSFPVFGQIPASALNLRNVVSILAMIFGALNTLLILFSLGQVGELAYSQRVDEDALLIGLLFIGAIMLAITILGIVLITSKNISRAKPSNMAIMVLSGIVIALSLLSGNAGGYLLLALLGTSITLHTKLKTP